MYRTKECLPSMCQALDSIPTTRKKKTSNNITEKMEVLKLFNFSKSGLLMFWGLVLGSLQIAKSVNTLM